MASEDAKFTCPTCGKQYRWKPELAGRSAKCACGTKLVVPAEAPSASTSEPVPMPKPPAAAPAEPKCPSCKSPLPASAVLCVNCGYNLKTGKKLAAVVVEVEEDGDEEEPDEKPAGSAK